MANQILNRLLEAETQIAELKQKSIGMERMLNEMANVLSKLSLDHNNMGIGFDSIVEALSEVTPTAPFAERLKKCFEKKHAQHLRDIEEFKKQKEEALSAELEKELKADEKEIKEVTEEKTPIQ